MNSPVKHLLGNMFVDAQSETTEAGIRQFLKNDALPVIFDEAESEDKRAAERMQSVLNIMRASSSSDGGKIIKGAAGGTAVQFDIRSCFAFASIGANLTQRSDISRITVLEIKHDISPDKKERWTETQKMFSEIYNDDYVQSFQSRSLLMLPTILQNSKTFSSAAAAELDNQRAGDQLGALLAGAYSLTSDKLISFEDATKWIKERDWSEERAADSTRDEVKVINRIMDAETSVETTGYGNKVRTIGELIIIGRNEAPKHEEYIINDDQAKIWLKRLGIKIEGEFIIVSDNSEFIRKTLVNTAYAKNYHIILSRVNGAEKVESTRFGSHVRSKATKIPFVEIFGENIKSEKPDLAMPHKKLIVKEK
jgi:putative DNA primase/helicase